MRKIGRSAVLLACILTVGCGDVSDTSGKTADKPESGAGVSGQGAAAGGKDAQVESAGSATAAQKEPSASERTDVPEGTNVVDSAEEPDTPKKENVIVLNEDMSVEEYLDACGMKEISSPYLNLKAVEDIVYVPIGSEVEIYRFNIYCGRIGLERFYKEDWTTDPQYVLLRFRGPRARHTELDISQKAASQGLMMACHRESDLYNLPYLKDWMLENGYVLTKEELTERTLTDYFAAYGQEGSEYGWVMELSDYLVDEELFATLLEAVEVKGEKLNGNQPEGVTLAARAVTGSRPGTYRREAELLMPGNSDGVVEGDTPFAFHFQAGDSSYSVPAGTVVMKEEDGWKLYAYASYYLSEIGDVSLQQLELKGRNREDIIAQDMGESWQEENLTETETGFEYTVREGNYERHYVVDSGSGMMIRVNRFAADDRADKDDASVSDIKGNTEEYLKAYGVEEYSSKYLKLKAAENVLYVPRQEDCEDDAYSSYIDIYHSGIYCGYIGSERLWYMGEEWKDWSTNSGSTASHFGGARTMSVEQEVPEQAASQGLAMLFWQDADLYHVPSCEGWMLKNGYFLTEEEPSERSLTSYLAVYGREGSGYVYAMILSDYLVDEELLETLLEAVEIEGVPGEEILQAENGARERPLSVLSEDDLAIGTINPRGSRPTAFYFQAGESVYSVPVGTVAAADGDAWKLYAYVNYDLSEIGEISLRRLGRRGGSREEIVAQDMGEPYREENLTETETGFEYRVREGAYESVYVVDEASGMMIKADYIAGRVRTPEEMGR